MNSEKIFKQLDFLAQMVPAPFYWVDLKIRMIGANQHVLKAIGAPSLDRIIGKSAYEIYSFEIADIIHKDIEKVIRTGKSSYVEDEIIDITTGKPRFYAATRSPIRDYDGNIIGVVGTSIEITAEKEAEELRNQNQRLEIEKEGALSDLKIQQALSEEQNKFQKVVGQMVHDIQSPLSSLNSLLTETNSEIPESKRNILRTVLTGISDITNHMLKRYANSPDAEDKQRQPVLVSTILLQAMSEKRYEYKDKSIEFKNVFRPETEFSFIKTEPSAFKRMLSNLINNAVDALENKPNGKVELRLSANNEKVTICVQDNGKGMTEEQIAKIEKSIEFSEGKKAGHGIGLSQVKDTLDENEGILEIDSEINFGTTMILKFPRIAMPTWITDEIKLIKDDIIIILDDDESIHYAWDDRFTPIIEKVSEIQIKHFREGLEAISYINSLSDKEQEHVYLLTDYELLKQEVNGIDVIKQVKFRHALLVTSHYDNPEIRDLAIDNQIKILPKNMAFAVKIQVDKKLEPGSRKVDLVWVDDEKAMIDNIVKDRYSHLKVDTYGDPISFLEDVHQYPLDTRIILDHHYYSLEVFTDLNGIKVARILHDKGYTNLILTTGELPNKVPEFLKVVLKKDLAKLFSLDKI